MGCFHLRMQENLVQSQTIKSLYLYFIKKVLSQEEDGIFSNLHFLLFSYSQWLSSNDKLAKLLALEIMIIAQTPGTFV